VLLNFWTTNSRREQTYGTYSLITRGSTKTLSCSPQVGLHCAPHLSLSLCTTTKPRQRQQNHSLSLSLSLLLTNSQKFHFRFPGFLKINQSHYTITFSLPLHPFHYIKHSANKNPVFAHHSQWKLLSPPALTAGCWSSCSMLSSLPAPFRRASPAQGCSIIARTRDESLSTLLRHVLLGAKACCCCLGCCRGGEGKGGKKGDAVVPRVYVCVGTTLSVWEETVLEAARTVLLCYEVIWSVAWLSAAFEDCGQRFVW